MLGGGEAGDGGGVSAVAGAAPMQSPAQSLVPLTVPTNLHPIGACGLICAGRLADFGGAVCANAFVAKTSAIITKSPFIAVTEIISLKGVSFRKRRARTRGRPRRRWLIGWLALPR